MPDARDSGTTREDGSVMGNIERWPETITLSDGSLGTPHVPVAEHNTAVDEVNALRRQLRGAVDIALAEIVEEARDGDEMVSGYDMAVRVGTIVLDRLKWGQ